MYAVCTCIRWSSVWAKNVGWKRAWCENVIYTHADKKRKLEFSGLPLPAFFQFHRHTWFISTVLLEPHLQTFKNKLKLARWTWPWLQVWECSAHSASGVEYDSVYKWDMKPLCPSLCSLTFLWCMSEGTGRNRGSIQSKCGHKCMCMCMQLWNKNEKAKAEKRQRGRGWPVYAEEWRAKQEI